MKRVFILVLLLIISFGYSQAPILEPGVYRANVKGQKVMLKIFEDNKYEMAVFYGNYKVENDTITFLNREQNESAFQIKINKDAPFSSTLKIKFKTQGLIYATRGIYIGIQKEDNAIIEYKPLSEYLSKRSHNYNDRQKELKIDVDKTKYLYFVDSNQRSNTIVSKFEIDQNYNEIEVDYDGTSLLNFELKGTINPETKKLLVAEGRTQRDMLEFEKDGVEKEKTDAIKAVAVLSEKDWMKKNGFMQEVEFDSSYLEKRPKANNTFKHVIAKNYSESLKSLEKTPEKFLVVVIDDGKESKKDFDKFIKIQEEKLSRQMRRGYDAEKDRFNFYRASEKDKTTIENFKIKEKKALLFLNVNGELLYHTVGTLEDNSNLFASYYSVYDEVKRASEQLKLDKLINNKKATLTDFKRSFFEITNAKKTFNHYDNQAVVDTVVEDEYATETFTVDTAAVAYEEDANYLQVDDPENLYEIKAPKEIISEKWKLIVNLYTQNNTYDEDFIQISKKELLSNGFIYKLYGGQKLVGETDFKILDYLYKNHAEILKNEEKHKNEVPTDEYQMNNEFSYQNSYDGIIPVLSSFFQKMTSESSHLHRSNQIKLLGYYKTFLQFSGFKLADFKNYLERIKESNLNDNSLYFSEYQEFFQTVDSRSPSLIESLDEMFVAQRAHFMNWSDFKRSYSQLANTVAWDVVETKNNDINTIQKAIKWSETSLKIDKNNHNYLDTLAQLYYKNNEKEKGIATEQKAIDGLKSTDKERMIEYTEVLEKMKNGTY